jgi:hypothetical protein
MAKKKPETETALEAEQPKVTKAQVIRDALAADPKGMPKDIADKLTAAGVRRGRCIASPQGHTCARRSAVIESRSC